MEHDAMLLERLHQLETDIQKIKVKLAPNAKPRWVDSYIRRPCKFVLSNWGFFAFLLTLCFALWTYGRYGVGYFESQKAISLTKKSAESYRQLGDRLMLYGEFDAAKDAYRTALKASPSDLEATRGLLKTQVFEPLEGQKYVIPEIASAKVEHLKELLQRDEDRGLLGFFGLLKPKVENEEGYIIDYFEGQVSEAQGDYHKARISYGMALKKNPKFIHGYMALAFVSYLQGDIDGSVATLETAKDLNPNSAAILSFLGDCYMLKVNFLKARELFESASKISPYLVTILNEGEVNRYLGDGDTALDKDMFALQMLGNSADEKERFVSGGFLWNYMPEKTGDSAPPYSATVVSINDKKMLVYYWLSLDHALRRDLDKANEAFDQARQMDPERRYDAFIANRIVSIVNFNEKLSGPTKAWMEKKRSLLAGAPQN